MVDPSIKGIAIAMFMFTSSLIGSTSGVIIGYIADRFNLTSEGDPKEYGYLIFSSTALPCLLAMPCFLIAGYKYKKMKN